MCNSCKEQRHKIMDHNNEWNKEVLLLVNLPLLLRVYKHWIG